MWWWTDNHKSTSYRLVFVTMPGQTAKTDQMFFELAGLSPDQYLIVEKPTQFKKIFIPDEAIYNLECGHPAWLNFFDLIKENVRAELPKSTTEKIYLSRTKLPKNDCVNEEYLESIAKKQGYTVVYPEKLALAEQINLIMNAKSIAATIGTLTHMAVFAESGTELICFPRRAEEVIQPQIVIDQLRNLDEFIVDAVKNPLPVTHVKGVFLFGLTPYFSDFMRYKSWNYDPNYQISDEILLNYLKRWTDHYSKPQNYVMIRNATIWDTVKGMNWAFYGRELQEKEYNIASKKVESPKKNEPAKQKKVGLLRRVWRFIKKKII